MSKFTLLKLTCYDQQESSGDEIYFKFSDNGGSGSGKSAVFTGMDAGDVRSIYGSFNFSGSVKVGMWESDGDHWYDRDDHIMTFSPVNAPVGYSNTLTFSNSEVNYSLEYIIT